MRVLSLALLQHNHLSALAEPIGRKSVDIDAAGQIGRIERNRIRTRVQTLIEQRRYFLAQCVEDLELTSVELLALDSASTGMEDRVFFGA